MLIAAIALVVVAGVVLAWSGGGANDELDATVADGSASSSDDGSSIDGSADGGTSDSALGDVDAPSSSDDDDDSAAGGTDDVADDGGDGGGGSGAVGADDGADGSGDSGSPIVIPTPTPTPTSATTPTTTVTTTPGPTPTSAPGGSGGSSGGSVTPPPGLPDGCAGSTELVCTDWPHAFVFVGTRQPIVGNGVNLQDAVETDWHYDLSKAVQPGSPAFDVVRIALNWPVLEPERGRFDAAAFEQLDRLIADARSAGMHVVLDAIHLRRQRQTYWDLYPGSTWNMPAWAWESVGVPVSATNDRDLDPTYDCAADEALATNGLGYLTEIVRRYANDPTVIAIDLVNEPRNSCWGLAGEPSSGPAAAQYLLDLQLGWVDQLRRVDPDKVFIIEPMYGEYDPARLDLSGLASRPNLVWSVHDYYSGVGAVYAASGVAAGSRAARYDLSVVARADRQAAMADMLGHVVDTLAGVGVPVFVGEYGFVMSSPNLAEAFADKRELYDAAQVPRTYWVLNYDRWGFELLVEDSSWAALATVLTDGATH
ncbi:MAG: cellulase family glycosylhydrolase [Acidimicrobiales bacterium]|nr:cellulase family glycosylhydrolase [Acidimicrobiales bacterium]